MTAPAPKPAPKLAGGFLGDARGRLLPAAVPFAFFAAAAVFHVLAWLALLAGASVWPQWQGGLGWPLAALHLATLGTLLASAIGASLQLLPVATRQPVPPARIVALLWWVYVPGVALLALGMGLAQPTLLGIGAAAVLAAVALWGALLALNLRGARGMPGVVLHGWGAVAALALLLASAAALVALWLGRPLLDRDSARIVHAAAGLFGTMGLLALGLSYILLPMFVLAPVPDERRQIASGAAALVAVALACVAAAGVAPTVWRALALAAGSGALALHLALMRRTFAAGMRRDLGRAGVLMRIGWGSLAAALVLAAASLAAPEGEWADRIGRLFVVAAVAGWLLSFLLGVLQRIVPFLAAMHAAPGRKRPPTPSMLTVEAPLAWHLRAHVAALALLVAGTAAASPGLTALAAVAGAAGAGCFAVFVAVALMRLRAARAPQA